MNNRIVLARKYAGLSQKELATKMGISPSTLNGYEKGNHDPKSPGLIAISNICNVTTDYLLGLSDIPNQANNLEHRSISYEEFENHLIDTYGKLTLITFNLYTLLDSDDQGEIRGEMKQMLRTEKYLKKRESKHA